MIKDEQIVGDVIAGREINCPEALRHVVEEWRIETRPSEDGAQGVNITAKRNSPEQCGFQRGGAAAHERIINHVTGVGEPFDKKAR